MKKTVCLVTGGTSGIGKAVCTYLLQQDCCVYELSRRKQGSEGTIHYSADVTDENDVIAAVEKILAETGGIDVLVNCAGFGISGAVEFTDARDAKRQMDVNFFGIVNVTKAVLPSMRRRGSGRIVSVSSVAAPVAIPFQTFYSASKAAINAYTLALANEVRPYGIQVCAVQPGDIATGFTDARKKSEDGDDEYSGRISRSVAVMERDERGGMNPAAVGKKIGKIALKKSSKPIYTIGFSYQLVCLLVRLLPTGLMNRLVGKLYAN